MPETKSGAPQRQIITQITIFSLVMFIFNILNYLFYWHQDTAAEQLRGELEAERAHSDKLSLTLEELRQELWELQQKYAQLEEEEKKQWAEKTSGGSGPLAYLTIDDGPSENTLLILDILKEYNIAATFFVTGYNDSGDEQIYKRILSEGHALGNHTYSHNFNTIYRSVDAFWNDVLRMEQIIYEQTGIKPVIIRFPGGSSNTVASSGVMPELIRTVIDRGYDYFDWNISLEDAGGGVPVETLINNVATQMKKYEGRDLAVLMHDHYLSQNTVAALPRIIEILIEAGYQFAPVRKGVINMKHR
jgi:peptidoglycan/xylan/chitin deacetylase (PgdA/CDA1 family)